MKKTNIIKLYFLIGALFVGTILVVGSFASTGLSSKMSADVNWTFRYLKYTTAFAHPSVTLADAISSFNIYSKKSSPSTATDIPVLLYHGIVQKPDRFSMTSDTFANQMFALKNAGYHTVTIEQFDDFMKGKITLPDKSFLLTFDDGRKDSYVGADPVLKAVGFEAVMFVPPGDTLDLGHSTYYLNESDMKDMLASGRWEFGSHAIQADTLAGEITIDSNGDLGNLLSNKMWLASSSRLETDAEYTARIDHELTDSKAQLEKTFGVHITSFAYPFSDYGQQGINAPIAIATINTILKKNYDVAFEQANLNADDEPTDVVSNYAGDNSYHLRRIEVPTDWTGTQLVSLLTSAHAKTLPYSDVFSSNAGWHSTWGITTMNDGTFNVMASTTTTGAFAFLDGTRGLQDYLYTAQVTVPNARTTVTLVSRYQDEGNYLSCSFDADQVQIQERVGGVIQTLSKIKNSVALPQSSVSLGIFVGGSIIKCYEGSRVAAYVTNYDNALSSGGVGLKIWEKDLGVAQMAVSNISVITEDTAKDFLATLPKYMLASNTPVQSGTSSPIVTITPPTASSSPRTSTATTPIASAPASFNVSLFDAEGSVLPYQLNFWNYTHDWKNMFGSLSQSDGSLSVGSNASTTSSLAVFQGGMQWEDYRLDTVVDWGKGSGFSLVGRYIDSKNYETCSFSDYGEYVSLYSTKDGVTSTLARSPRLATPDYAPWIGTKLGMTVQGGIASCLINGQWVVKGQTGLTQPGTIGFKSYYPNANGALMAIRSATVTAIESN